MKKNSKKQVSCKYTAKRILKKKPLENFSDDDQIFLKDMLLRLKSTKTNVDRLCLLANESGADIVYRGDCFKETGYVLATEPDKAANTKVNTPKNKSKNKGKYRSH